MKVLNTSYGSSKYFLCFVTTFLCTPIVKVKRVEGLFLLSFLRCVLRVKDLKVCETCESR